MDTDEAMTPEGSPSRNDEFQRKRSRSSSKAAAKSKRGKKRSKKKRKESSSSSSSNSESPRSSRCASKRRSKEKGSWSTEQVLDIFNTLQGHKCKTSNLNNNLLNNVIPELIRQVKLRISTVGLGK